jgi:hypothetical protein
VILQDRIGGRVRALEPSADLVREARLLKHGALFLDDLPRGGKCAPP